LGGTLTDIELGPKPEHLSDLVIRFAGDSGDGMQLTGDRFTSVSALFGNDLSTFPEYPAEIRAPAGTLAGVSSFQVRISDHEISTPGDAPTVLVAMNPAALRADLRHLVLGGMVIVNTDGFDERSLTKAGYATNPLTDDSLTQYRVVEVPMTALTLAATSSLGVKSRDAERSKNFFALGLISWCYSRPIDATLEWIDERFAKNDLVRQSNRSAFTAGFNFGETTELFDHPYQVDSAKLPHGEYTNITGNTALAWGLVAAGQCARLPVFLGSYPITPASDILHELSKHKNFGVRTFQAEDEIAAIGSALGAAFAGHLGVTTTSGPGVALKGETISLAISLELPLLIVDIQRGGPSTGLPTKTEAADLLMALYGRHGEAPIPVIAAYNPPHCFDAAIEAARIALKYRTPVIVLSDGYLANGAHPWKLPNVADLPDISVPFATELNHQRDDGAMEYWPYLRDAETLARPWAIPGTPHLMHRVGGIEKEDGSGNISYTPENHEKMVHLRADKIAGIAKDIPLATVMGDEDAELLILGWGSTWGAIKAALADVRKTGNKVAWVHLVHLNPFPANLGAVLARYRKIIVPEMNLGQLCKVVRSEFLVPAQPINKVQGMPFTAAELRIAIETALETALERELP
jgi:2-oxoglutarate/2-oxoacid ferredoxin oxidoreductase subunit alpha